MQYTWHWICISHLNYNISCSKLFMSSINSCFLPFSPYYYIAPAFSQWFQNKKEIKEKLGITLVSFLFSTHSSKSISKLDRILFKIYLKTHSCLHEPLAFGLWPKVTITSYLVYYFYFSYPHPFIHSTCSGLPHGFPFWLWHTLFPASGDIDYWQFIVMLQS